MTTIIHLLVIACQAAASEPVSLEELLRQVESHQGPVFDLHGNPTQAMRELMLMRYDGSMAIMRRIDNAGSNDRLERSLYAVLGVVKDPKTLDWLRTITWVNKQMTRHTAAA